MRITYRPGSWNALIADRGVIVLPADADPAFVVDVWNGLETTAGLGALVDLLAQHSGGSLAGLPDFVAITTDESDVRVAVRGPLEVVAETAEGKQAVSGSDVSTWSERVIRQVSRVVIRAHSSAEPALPLGSGVVRAAEIVLNISESTDAKAAAPVAAGAVPASTPFVPQAEPEAQAPAPAIPAEDPMPPVPASPASTPLPALPLFTPVGAQPAAATVPVDTVPDTSAAPEQVSEQEHTPAPADTLLPEDVSSTPEVDEFDLLWGDTIHRPAVADAPPPPVAGMPPAPVSAPAGDHDGATISVAEANALRNKPVPAAPDAPTVVLPVLESETPVGRIRLSSGQSAVLDRTVIIGRRPRSARASGSTMPHLIAVESPQQDISRSHLEIRPEGDSVVVIDLHTTNGSTLLRQGADPMRLHPGEQTIVLSGDTIDLGDGITVTFEDLP